MTAADIADPPDWIELDDAIPLWLPSLGGLGGGDGDGVLGELIAAHDALCGGRLGDARDAVAGAHERSVGTGWHPVAQIYAAKVEFLAGDSEQAMALLTSIEPGSEAAQVARILAAHLDHCAGELDRASMRLRTVEPNSALVECLHLRARMELRLEQGRLEAVRRDASSMRRVAIPESLVDYAAFADLVTGICDWLDGRSSMDVATPFARFVRDTDHYSGCLVAMVAAATTWSAKAATVAVDLPALQAFARHADQAARLWRDFHASGSDEDEAALRTRLGERKQAALDDATPDPWIRLLERELDTRLDAQLPPSGDDPVVRAAVHSSCDWIRVGEQTADLAARRALRLIMKAMLKAHFIDPSRQFCVEDVLAAGWPGEPVVESAARSRVYTAIRQLRTMGLGDLIVTEDDGYRISRNAQISVEATTELAALLPDKR